MGLYLMGMALAVGLGLPIAVIGAGIGQGKVGAAAMEAMARQPEMAGRIQTGAAPRSWITTAWSWA